MLWAEADRGSNPISTVTASLGLSFLIYKMEMIPPCKGLV